MASVLFVIATAVLALWVDARFPGLAPAEVMRTGIHIGIAFVASTVAAPIVSDIVHRHRLAAGAPGRTGAGAGGAGLPLPDRDLGDQAGSGPDAQHDALTALSRPASS